MHPTGRVQPGHRIAQPPQPEVQLRAHCVPVHHIAGGQPALGGAVKLRGCYLHIGRALAVAGKPEGGERGRVAYGHGQEIAGMGRQSAFGHGYFPGRHRLEQAGVHALGSRRKQRLCNGRCRRTLPKVEQQSQGHQQQCRQATA